MEQIGKHQIRNVSHRNKLAKWGAVLIGLLAIVYVINFFTPLRLTNDTVRYLTIKESIESGTPVHDYLPYGYVFFLLLLSKLNILCSFPVSLLQFSYLVGALLFVKKLFPNTSSVVLFSVALLQWTTMKYVITLLSEMQFTFFSVGTIYFFQRFKQARKAITLLWMILFLAMSILTRTVGVVLIPALCGAMVLESSVPWKQTFFRSRWTIAIFLLFAIAVFVFQRTFRVDAYYHLFVSNDLLRVLKNDIINHLIDFAAIFLNVSYSKFPVGWMPFVTAIDLIIGFIFFIIVTYLLVRARKRVPMIVKLYLLFYSLVIFFWPFFDPRFWVPIIPLLIVSLAEAVQLIPRRVKWMVNAYCVYYVLAGWIAMGYYTYTSTNKHVLAVKQDASIWVNEYEQYFFGKPTTHPGGKVRQNIVRLLEKYD